MMNPHIVSSWLANGQMIVRVLFPNGVERVMLREKFVSLMNENR